MAVGIDFSRVYGAMEEVDEMRLRMVCYISDGKMEEARRINSEIYNTSYRVYETLTNKPRLIGADEIAADALEVIFFGILQRSSSFKDRFEGRKAENLFVVTFDLRE